LTLRGSGRKEARRKTYIAQTKGGKEKDAALPGRSLHRLKVKKRMGEGAVCRGGSLNHIPYKPMAT